MPFIISQKNKWGVTLIELLITISILSVISLALYSSLNNSLKIWNKVSRPLVHEDLDLFFDKFAYDLRNCIRFTGIHFMGTEDRLEFPTIVYSQNWAANIVGKVSYIYDPQTKILARIQQDFSQIYSGEESAKNQPITQLESLKFRYYIYNKETKEYLWKDDFLEGEFPIAVRIELELGNDAQVQSFTRTVSIPIAS